MPPPTSRPIPCPRCGAPVTGEFKFCPRCAYRLRSDVSPVEATNGGPRRWTNLVIALLLGGLLVAVVLVGVLIFAPPEPPPPTPTPPGAAGALTVARIPDLMRNLYGGVPMDWPTGAANDPEGPDVPDYLPVKIGPSRFLRFEVTRGMYAEYLQACSADPAQVPAFLVDLLRPQPQDVDAALAEPMPDAYRDIWRAAARLSAYATRLAYADSYIDFWWEATRAHLENTLPEGESAARPTDLRAPLPDQYGILLLVPPSWVYVTSFDDLDWRLPPDTADLPVTEVSWFDASAFAEWVSARLDIVCRLPADLEWVRAGNGGDSQQTRRYPWGDAPLKYACNSRSFWEPDPPRLHAVDYRYSDADGDTPEGVWGMAGNAREWTVDSRKVQRNGYFAIDTQDAAVRGRGDAPTFGGSFREGIHDCVVDYDSLKYIDKRSRHDSVGFRLWMRGDWMGG